MKSADQYPVYFPYGATSSPYSQSNPHKGDDRCNAVGVPVVVNGVQIGLTGYTGYVVPKSPAGAHLHVGRYVNGVATNPNKGGFNLKAPVTVTTVAEDNSNGKYVRLTDGDGVQWVYLHLSQQDVKVGQVIGGDVLDTNTINSLYGAYQDRVPSQGEVNSWVGRECKLLIDALNKDPFTTEVYKQRQAGKSCLANPPGFKTYAGEQLYTKDK